MDKLFFVGFVQALFFIMLILTKKNLKKSDFVLSVFLLIIGLKLLFISATETNYYLEHPRIIFIECFYWTMIGPALYIYIDLVTSEVQKFKIHYLIHLTPTIIVLAGIWGYFFSDEYASLLEYKSDTLIFKISIYVWYFNAHLYYIFCLIRLRSHPKRIKKYFSNTKEIDLKWLNFLTYGFAIFLFYLFAYLILAMFFKVKIPYFNNYVLWLTMVMYVFGIGFYGFKQQGIFNTIYDLKNDKNSDLSNKSPLYKKSGLSEEEKNKIIVQLKTYMDEEKPYLDPDLNIRQLAESLEIPVHKLSQTINQSIQKTFFEFINEYRIKVATDYLTGTEFEKYSIISIAYECGFNSKTSFYNIFKKHTSKTPTQYRESYLNVN
ncbi:helix-turn-helix domain-containing protein [Bacteroidota bacterium]